MPTTLMKSGDIQGLPLVGQGDAKLGTVREAFVDPATGHIEFVMVEIASLLGSGGKFHPVPWNSVRYDPAGPSFKSQIAKDAFKAAPSYDREQLASPDYGWSEQAFAIFRRLFRQRPLARKSTRRS